MSSIANPGNYLRTSRNFPTEPQHLSVELSKTYVDIANQVNNKISGIFAITATVTSESWFVQGQGQKQQTLRQVYPVTTAGSYPHGINIATVSAFTRIWGTFVDNSVPAIWFPLPYVNVVAANNQISLHVTSTNIVITAGGGTPPTMVSGYVVLEWLSQF